MEARRSFGLVQLLKRGQKRNYGYVHVPKKKPPHLLGFGNEWRKCFVVHPQSQAPRPLEGYLWLTGSVLRDGLPDSLPSVESGAAEGVALLEERLVAAAVLGKGEREGVERVCHVLTSGLAGLWMNGAEHLRTGRLTRKPRVESYWRCGQTNFLCVTQPLFILHCTHPLPLFSDHTHYYDPLPSVMTDPSHLGLFEHSFDQITPFAGCHRFSPTGFTHTIISASLRGQTREQLLAHGLMQLFSQATAECLQNGYPLNNDLPHPLSLQCLLCSGHQITFLTFQLNTLVIGSRERGHRNVLWAGPTLELFSEGRVNRKCSELMWQMLMHCPARKRPSLSGFGQRVASS